MSVTLKINKVLHIDDFFCTTSKRLVSKINNCIYLFIGTNIT